MPNWLYYSLQTKNFPFILKLYYNIEANERLTKIKEKWSTIKFNVFVLSFTFFVPMSQTISVKNRNGACYFLQTFYIYTFLHFYFLVARVLTCSARAITRIKWRIRSIMSKLKFSLPTHLSASPYFSNCDQCRPNKFVMAALNSSHKLHGSCI